MPYAAAVTHLNPVGNTPVLPSQFSLRDLKVQCTSTISSRTPAQILSPADKPLKSSLKLKCRSTSSDSESASTPAGVLGNAALPLSSRKSVRFKDTVGSGGGLESVRLFRQSETDSESSEEALESVHFKIIDISQIPSLHTPSHSNIHLEDLTLYLVVPACSPHAHSRLRGTVRVRNLAPEKRVVARFTSDDWTTVSEVRAWYTDPHPSAPSDGDGVGWDRFRFSISLEMYAPPPGLGLKASPRTLLVAVSLVVPGIGEWWDNNGGNNFYVVLAPAETEDQAPALLSRIIYDEPAANLPL